VQSYECKLTPGKFAGALLSTIGPSLPQHRLRSHDSANAIKAGLACRRARSRHRPVHRAQGFRNEPAGRFEVQRRDG
jgi:hypothetical protein